MKIKNIKDVGKSFHNGMKRSVDDGLVLALTAGVGIFVSVVEQDVKSGIRAAATYLGTTTLLNGTINVVIDLVTEADF